MRQTQVRKAKVQSWPDHFLYVTEHVTFSSSNLSFCDWKPMNSVSAQQICATAIFR